MLAFDVVRTDWRDALRERAFRRGLLLLPAGERTLRFYPRHDTEPYAIDEGLAILRAGVEDVLGGRVTLSSSAGPNIRVGKFECPVEAVEIVDVTPANLATWQAHIATVEQERYGDIAAYPPGVLHDGQRPLLQLPLDALETSVLNPQSVAIAVRDRISDRVVGYALGSPLENYDEEGVASDPHHGEGNTFYLHAMAILPSVQNQTEIENLLLENIRARVHAAGFEYLSTLIEERICAAGPVWLRDAPVLLGIDSYLQSGLRFVYVAAPVEDPLGAPAAVS